VILADNYRSITFHKATRPELQPVFNQQTTIINGIKILILSAMGTLDASVCSGYVN
jgi:hypothetical protein